MNIASNILSTDNYEDEIISAEKLSTEDEENLKNVSKRIKGTYN